MANFLGKGGTDGDRSMLLPKLFYFFYFSAAASLVPFLVIYYEQLGLSGRQIGLLTGLSPLVMLISAPLWGGLADATRSHTTLLKVAIGGVLVMVLVLSATSSFFWLILVVTVYAFFAAPITPLVDNTVIDLLQERKDQYGKQRLWGAVGWGIAAPVIGWLIERSGVQWAFYGYLILMTGCLLVSWPLAVSQKSIGARFWAGLRLLLANRSWILFLGAVFIGGMSLAVISNFLFLFLNDLGASKTLMGLSLTAATLSEIPVLFLADRLLNRWGAKGLLSLALLACAVRASAYSLMGAVWLVLPIQLLHGPTFAAIWAAGVSYAAESAPEGMGATAQGLFAGVLFGLGSACGAVVGGLLYDSVGAVLMFRWAGLAVLLGLAAFLLLGRTTPAGPAGVAKQPLAK